MEHFNNPTRGAGEINPVWGEHLYFDFPNGWTASVVRGPHTYGGAEGLWELAVLAGPDGDIDYSTPITKDVIGHQSEDEIDQLLKLIAALDDRVGP